MRGFAINLQSLNILRRLYKIEVSRLGIIWQMLLIVVGLVVEIDCFFYTYVIVYLGMAFQANNASWRNLRKIFTLEIMSPKRLQASEHMRAKEVDYMLNSIFCDAIKHPNTPVKINTKLWLLLSNFVSRLVLNKRYFIPQGDKESEEVKHFKEVMNENFFLLGSIFPGDGLPFLKPFDIGGFQKRTKILVPKMQGILTQILSERRELREKEGEAHVDVDMVDVLLTQQARGGKEPITEGNIRGLLWVQDLNFPNMCHIGALN